MMMRTFALLIAVVTTTSNLQASESQPPNVVFIMVDDLGWSDVSFNGSKVYETPNVDRLASQGMVLSDFYSGGPVCSPTRASIMTGKYTARTAITTYLLSPTRDAPHVQSHLPLKEFTIAEAFKKNGFATGYFGKWHLGYENDFWAGNQGFDVAKGGIDLPWAWTLCYPDIREAPTAKTWPKKHIRFFSPYHLTHLENGPKDEYLTDRLTNETIDFIEEQRREPFFVFLSFHTVHTPLQAKSEKIEKYTKKIAALGFDSKKEKNGREKAFQNNPAYAAMVEHMDENVGRLLARLDELKLSDNTIVVWTSDNGGKGSVTSNLPLRGMKHNLYEGGIRVPTIVRWPTRIAAGAKNATPLISNDFYPTLLELTGQSAESQQHIDGVSFASVLLGESESVERDAIYWHYPHSRQEAAVREGRYKLLHRFRQGSVELYDLRADIGERKDLSEEKPETAKRLLEKLRSWQRSVSAKFEGDVVQRQAAKSEKTHERPNVLFISVDDWNDWVGCLGHQQAQTPNVDRLASRGLLFTNAHCVAPVCNPSRAATLTGLRPDTTGIYENNHVMRRKVPDVVTLPQHFRAQGYHVVGGGKIFHDVPPHCDDPQSWDEYFWWNEHGPKGGRSGSSWRSPYSIPPDPQPKDRPTREITTLTKRNFDWGAIDQPEPTWPDSQVAAWASEFLAKKHDKPFFLSVGIFRPHVPWFNPTKYVEKYPLDDLVLPPFKKDDLDDLGEWAKRRAHDKASKHDQVVKFGEWKSAVQAYLASISFADANVGRVLDALEKSSYRDNTIVVFWSDHGYHLGEKGHWHKRTLWERSTRVPFVIAAPGTTEAGTKCTQPVSLLDIYPTLISLCGLDEQKQLEGNDLSFLLSEPNSEWQHAAVTTWQPGNHSVRTDDWRYIRYRTGEEELYDHRTDPNEWDNLAAKPEFAKKKIELAKHLPKPPGDVGSNDAPTKIETLAVVADGNAGSFADDRPNVLFISLDDMNDWLGCYGGHPDAVTPNIDRLAKRGILFTNAHCVSPICGPSRASVLTGMRPETTGVYHNRGQYIDYVPIAVTFPEHFRANGYRAMAAGKVNHDLGAPDPRLWDENGPDCGVLGTPFVADELHTVKMTPERIIDRGSLKITLPANGGLSAIDRPNNTWDSFDWAPLDCPETDFPDRRIADWGVEQLRKRHDKPFLLALGFYKPHQPFFAPRKYFEFYDPTTTRLPLTIAGDLYDVPPPGRALATRPWTSGTHKTVAAHGAWRDAVRAYLATVSFADAMVGRVVDALDTSPYSNNTWIIFWSDHGWSLGEKEHWGKHVPWRESVRMPLMIVPPRNAVLKGFTPGSRCEAGVSLLDLYPTLVDACSLPNRKELEGKSLLPLVANPTTKWNEAVVTTVGRGTHSVSTNRWRYIRYFDGSEELYDIKIDPREWFNVAGRVEHTKLKQRLAGYIREDPRFKQFVRWGRWKCVIPIGKPMLFDYQGEFGISEQNDVASEHPAIVSSISTYLKQNQIHTRRVVIPDQD